MRTADAYHFSVDGTTLIPACGTAAHFNLDGRWSVSTQIIRASDYFRNAGYPAFKLPHSQMLFTV
jgi:hypothetical protein